MEGNQTLTLALVWQLMRAYTLSLLSKVFVTSDQGLVAKKPQVLFMKYKYSISSTTSPCSPSSTRTAPRLWRVRSSLGQITRSCKQKMQGKIVWLCFRAKNWNIFSAEWRREELPDQTLPRQDEQDSVADHRSHRRHEDWRHRVLRRQDWLQADRRGTNSFNYTANVAKMCFPPQDCLSNAKYAVNMARKIGAPVYALPEDISEVMKKSLKFDKSISS